MSRVLLLATILGLVAVGLLAESLPSPRSWVSKRVSDAIGTASEGPLVNATKSDLATEKKKLDQELCEGRKGRSTPVVEAEKESGAPKEDGKPVVTEQKTEKLPGNKTKEVVVTEQTEKLPSNATVKKTVERQVVKGADGKASGNGTVIEKEIRTDTSPFNATVTKTVTEHTVAKGEEATEQEIEKEKTETVTEKEEVETYEKPEPEKLPINATVKKTSVESKVVKNTSKDGEPQKEIVIDKKTQTDTTKTTGTPSVGIVDASVLDEKAGPKMILVTKEKIEKLPGNETKEVLIKEKAEKLPSNDTIKTTVVERKTTKDTSKDSDTPQQETVTEKEVEQQITNKSTEVKAPQKCKTQEYKAKVENIKQQVQEVKEEIKEEEIKTSQLGGVPGACVKGTKIKKPVKEPVEEKKVVETVIPVKKAVKEVKELEGIVTEKHIPVSEKLRPVQEVVSVLTTEKEVPPMTEGKKPVVQTVIPVQKVTKEIKEVKDEKVIEKPVSEKKLPR